MIILNDSHDSFCFRLAAAGFIAVSFIEGRQITQEDDLRVSTLAGFMSLSAFALSCLNIYQLANRLVFEPVRFKSSTRIVLQMMIHCGLLIRIACLRVKFLNPDDYLDRHHPLVWNYLGFCASILTLSVQ